MDALSACIDGVMVHLNDGIALLGVRSGSSVLHILDGVFLGEDLSQLEESRLQHGVDTAAQTDFLYRS